MRAALLFWESHKRGHPKVWCIGEANTRGRRKSTLLCSHDATQLSTSSQTQLKKQNVTPLSKAHPLSSLWFLLVFSWFFPCSPCFLPLFSPCLLLVLPSSLPLSFPLSSLCPPLLFCSSLALLCAPLSSTCPPCVLPLSSLCPLLVFPLSPLCPPRLLCPPLLVSAAFVVLVLSLFACSSFPCLFACRFVFVRSLIPSCSLFICFPCSLMVSLHIVHSLIRE